MMLLMLKVTIFNIQILSCKIANCRHLFSSRWLPFGREVGMSDPWSEQERRYSYNWAAGNSYSLLKLIAPQLCRLGVRRNSWHRLRDKELPQLLLMASAAGSHLGAATKSGGLTEARQGILVRDQGTHARCWR